MRVDVEICVSTVDEAVLAAAAGADTLEVCSWLASGGITPSSGLVDAIRQVVQIPVRVLVRPTPAGFVYSTTQSMVLLTDAEVFGGGALGLVTGGLNELGRLHVPLMRAVKEKAPESEITFHRAIDHAADQAGVIDDCLTLGIDRILTSGGAVLAIDGLANIKQMIERAGDRCVVAVAGGVDPNNVVEIVESTGAREVHFAAQKPSEMKGTGPRLSSTNPEVWLGTMPDEAKIEGVLNVLSKAGLR